MKMTFSLFLTCILWVAALPIKAEQFPSPVTVVELFTSQGCSSCPPADALIGEIAKDPTVLPLALHVDYWDYIGWKDTFARPEHSARQKKYAVSLDSTSIYTPQMVIGGVDQAVGSRASAVMGLIKKHQAKKPRVQLEVSLAANGTRSLNISRIGKKTLPRNIHVQLVFYTPKAQVNIKRGENAGLALHSTNVVTDIQLLGNWSGKTDIQFPLPAVLKRKGQKAAIILQEHKRRRFPSEIIAAFKLK